MKVNSVTFVFSMTISVFAWNHVQTTDLRKPYFSDVQIVCNEDVNTETNSTDDLNLSSDITWILPSGLVINKDNQWEDGSRIKMTSWSNHGIFSYEKRIQYSLEYIMLMVMVLCHTSSVLGARENYEAEYHSNVSLPCNFTLHNLTYPGISVPFLRYWILPNTSAISRNVGLNNRVQIVSPNQFTFDLFIASIEEEDYGVYHCFMVWNNIDYKSSTIRIGLNEDGPMYKAKLEQFERNVLIGCIAAGGVVLIIFIGCIVCRCRNKKKESLSDLDYYSTPTNGQGQGHRNAYEYNINAPATTSDPKKVQSVEEMYAKVNKRESTAPKADVAVHSEHL
ncbi:hypothetical protein ACF0H5_010452 [Mactra antiquata]